MLFVAKMPVDLTKAEKAVDETHGLGGMIVFNAVTRIAQPTLRNLPAEGGSVAAQRSREPRVWSVEPATTAGSGGPTILALRSPLPAPGFFLP